MVEKEKYYPSEYPKKSPLEQEFIFMNKNEYISFKEPKFLESIHKSNKNIDDLYTISQENHDLKKLKKYLKITDGHLLEPHTPKKKLPKDDFSEIPYQPYHFSFDDIFPPKKPVLPSVPETPKIQPDHFTAPAPKVIFEDPKPVQEPAPVIAEPEVIPTIKPSTASVDVQAVAPVTPKKKLASPHYQINTQDPYKTDPNRMTAAQRKKANGIYDYIMSGSDKHSMHIMDTIDTFCIRLSNEVGSIAGNDLSTQNNLKPLRESMAKLVSRYFAQTKDSMNSPVVIEELMEAAFVIYAKAYTVDIKYYQKVFGQFDSIRKTGRNFQEVYLGRDGVYAYIGRRAQDLAERRRIGLKARMTRKALGTDPQKPKYLIYPRFYRDQISPDAKSLYLKSQGVSIGTDPIFFDTGYTGTIPEQILRILGVNSDAEIDRRMKLLSATKQQRLVNGITPQDRGTVVEHIEHNVKAEHPSSGMMIDSEGRINPIAKPTEPKEQFLFEVIKLALSRHYWNAEMLKKKADSFETGKVLVTA